MMALSVHQPWAALTAVGLKTIELRSWSTTYRGQLLICASQKADTWDGAKLHPEADEDRIERAAEMAGRLRGVALCVVELVDCRPMKKGDAYLACRPYDPSLFSWVTDPSELRIIDKPYPVKGRLSLFDVPAYTGRLTIP